MISFTPSEWKMLKSILYKIAWRQGTEVADEVKRFDRVVETRIEKEEQNTLPKNCECDNWGRDSKAATLYLSHHPHCKRYQPEPEMRELLEELIDGIESWASDEDGVHPDCWDAYVRACGVCGQWGRPKARGE